MSATLVGDQSGNVKFTCFLDWLNEFMVYGSDQKSFHCGKDALFALNQFGNSEQNGFRMLNTTSYVFRPDSQKIPLTHNFQTPFGKAEIKADDALDDGQIVVHDYGVPDDSHIKDKAEATASNIRTIEP